MDNSSEILEALVSDKIHDYYGDENSQTTKEQTINISTPEWKREKTIWPKDPQIDSKRIDILNCGFKNRKSQGSISSEGRKSKPDSKPSKLVMKTQENRMTREQFREASRTMIQKVVEQTIGDCLEKRLHSAFQELINQLERLHNNVSQGLEDKMIEIMSIESFYKYKESNSIRQLEDKATSCCESMRKNIDHLIIQFQHDISKKINNFRTDFETSMSDHAVKIDIQVKDPSTKKVKEQRDFKNLSLDDPFELERFLSTYTKQNIMKRIRNRSEGKRESSKKPLMMNDLDKIGLQKYDKQPRIKGPKKHFTVEDMTINLSGLSQTYRKSRHSKSMDMTAPCHPRPPSSHPLQGSLLYPAQSPLSPISNKPSKNPRPRSSLRQGLLRPSPGTVCQAVSHQPPPAQAIFSPTINMRLSAPQHRHSDK